MSTNENTVHRSKTVELIKKVAQYCQKQCDANSEESLLWAQCKSMAQQAQYCAMEEFACKGDSKLAKALWEGVK
jgi:hypothetical protein